MALQLTTKYYVRVKKYTYRLDQTFTTIADAQAAINVQTTPADWYIQPEIVYVNV